MKRVLCYLLLFVAFRASQPSVGAQPNQPTKLIAETNHSTVQFSVPISNGLTRITGKFNEFSISVDLVENDITQSQISAAIKANSINTGIAGRDEDLKTKDFFETEKFPEITFVSNKIIKSGDGFIASGQFQMHGVTRLIDLPFKITGKSGDDVIGFTCRYSLNRSDFNLATDFKHTTDDHFIGNEIGIEIDFWTKRPKVKK